MPRRRSSRRDIRSDVLPPAASHSSLYTTFLLLSFCSLQGMVILFGGTRFWASGPFLGLFFLLSFIGSIWVWKLSKGEPGKCSVPLEVWTLLGLAGYAVVRAIVNSAIPYETWSEAYLLFSAALVWVVFTRWGASRSGWILVAVGLLSFVTLHSMHALGQHFSGERDILWLSRPEHYGMRASGTFFCPNHFAHYIQMAIIVAVGMLFIPRLRLSLKIICGYTICICVPVLFLTLSRAGVLGTIAGVGVVVMLSPLRKRMALMVSVLFGGSLIIGGSLTVLAIKVDPIRERLRDFGTNNIRWSQIWPDTLSMIQGEGLWGSGPGTYLYVFDTYREKFSASNLYLEYAHNEYLNTLAEYGWIPFSAILLVVGITLTRDMKASLRSDNMRTAMLPAICVGLVVATLVHALFDFQLHITANSLVLVMLLGTFHGAAGVRGLWPKRFLSSAWSRASLVLVALASLVMLGITLPLTMGSLYTYLARVSGENNDMEAAKEYAAKQRTWLPGRYEGWRTLGLEKRMAAYWNRDPEQKATFIKESRAAYDEALRLNPYDRNSMIGVIELLKMENRLEEALVQFDTLITYAPFDVQVRVYQGLLLKKMGRNRKALEVFQQAKRMSRSANRQIDLNIRTLRKLTSASE